MSRSDVDHQTLVTLADSLADQLTRLYVLIRRPLDPTELSTARLRLLYNLYENGPQRIQSLADADRVSQPSATAMVNALEALGLVRRKTDGTDRRAVLISITRKGEKTLLERRKRRAEVLAAQLSTLPQRKLAEVTRAVRVLDDLVAHLSAPDGDD